MQHILFYLCVGVMYMYPQDAVYALRRRFDRAQLKRRRVHALSRVRVETSCSFYYSSTVLCDSRK